ncbi:MAG: hypothetical protein ACRDV0_09285, partial [Acidimicrobiales bacterium]
MARPLRGDEVLACVHRVALSRGAPTDVTPAPSTPESERRRRDAREHRRATLDELASLHPNAPTPASVDETFDLIAAGEEIILRPRLALDREGGRVAVAQALVRVGRVDAGYRYAPVVV